MAVEERGRETQLAADGAHFVFIERRQGLDHAAFLDQLLNSGDAVVVGLDEIGLGGSAGFDGVRIDGALAENPAAVEEALGLQNPLLHLDELLADDVALLFRFDGALQGVQELRLGVLHLKAAGAQRGEVGADEIGFSFAHQAGIDVGAVNAVRAQAVEAQSEGDGGIDASADEEKDAAAGGGFANPGFQSLNLAGRVPVAGAAADAKHEIGQDPRAGGSVRHLGMELHAVETPVRRGHGGDRAGIGSGQDSKAGRGRGHQIAMAHPYLLAAGDVAKENILRAASQKDPSILGEAVFSAIALLDLSSQEISH